MCLQWEPEVIAVALMFLAGKLSKFEIVDWNGRTSKHNAWWDMFVEDISMELLEDICHQVMSGINENIISTFILIVCITITIKVILFGEINERLNLLERVQLTSGS